MSKYIASVSVPECKNKLRKQTVIHSNKAWALANKGETRSMWHTRLKASTASHSRRQVTRYRKTTGHVADLQRN